ncbi:hypothetical protein ACOMCU_25575 [Lysinibacillus sp. UGB7]|uniref:hypothetical protein n=1 Tax=Lysinibacillus sp. UGB7 TaxID=3411039 RepID=UPI003B777570
MSKYKVINRFQDKSHEGHIYEVGDAYPTDGKKLIKTRAESLTNIHKEYGVAFLEAVDVPVAPKKTVTKLTSKKVESTGPEKSDE